MNYSRFIYVTECLVLVLFDLIPIQLRQLYLLTNGKDIDILYILFIVNSILISSYWVILYLRSLLLILIQVLRCTDCFIYRATTTFFILWIIRHYGIVRIISIVFILIWLRFERIECPTTPLFSIFFPQFIFMVLLIIVCFTLRRLHSLRICFILILLWYFCHYTWLLKLFGLFYIFKMIRIILLVLTFPRIFRLI